MAENCSGERQGCMGSQGFAFEESVHQKKKSLPKVDMVLGTQSLEALGAGPSLPACSHNALHPLPQLQL